MISQFNIQKKIHFKNLDAIRTIAFLMVFISHAINKVSYSSGFINLGKKYLKHGDLGVKLFFVLSGFLITYLLLIEFRRNNSINVKYFLIRRVLRIWPLYFLILIIGICLPLLFFNLFGEESNPFPRDVIPISRMYYYSFFFANFMQVNNFENLNTISLLWSVSVEEQFYLFLPLFFSALILFDTSHKSFIKLVPLSLIILITLSTIFRISNSDNDSILKFHTFSLASDLGLGCLIGFISIYYKKFVKRICNIPNWGVISIVFITLLLLVFRRDIFNLSGTAKAFEPLIFGSLFAYLILHQSFSEEWSLSIGNVRILDQLGKLTYGLYCYHLLAIFIVLYFMNYFNIKFNAQTYVAFVVTSFSLTYIVSLLSFRYYESRFLSFKNKFSYVLRQ